MLISAYLSGVYVIITHIYELPENERKWLQQQSHLLYNGYLLSFGLLRTIDRVNNDVWPATMTNGLLSSAAPLLSRAPGVYRGDTHSGFNWIHQRDYSGTFTVCCID